MMGCMGWVDCAATCIPALSNKWGAQDPVSHQVAVGQDRLCLRLVGELGGRHEAPGRGIARQL